MALIDYAQKRQERVLVRSQAAVGVAAVVLSRDALKLRGAATIPAVLSDFVPSEEIRDTPDVDQFIRRKKPPGEFELTCYAKVPSTKGRLPQWSVLARDTFGVEQNVIEIVAFAGLTGDTVTVTIDGTPNVLTEGVEWTAATSNAATATSLAAAINALAGVGATAVGAEVLVTRDQGTGEVALTTSGTMPTDINLSGVRYSLKTDILEEVFTLVHGAHNAAHYYRDCKCSAMVVSASGSDEATITFRGLLGNEVYIGQTKLNGAIAGGGVADDVKAFAFDDSVVQIGPLATDTVYFQVDSEIFEIITWDPDAKTGTAKCGKLGTTVSAHSDDAEVFPYLPAVDPDANDTIIPLTLGTFLVGATPHRIISLELTKDEQINGRLDEWGESALTGYRRDVAGRLVEGTFVAYQRRTILELMTFGEREKEAVTVITIGSPALNKPNIVITLPKFRIGKVEKEESGGEFTRSFPFQGLASSTPGNDGISIQTQYD